MLQQPTDFKSALDAVHQLLEVPFWKHPDFWISSIIGVAGVCVSFLAYRQAEKATQEAEKAKQAATEAGKTVKLQTMAVELSEVNQKLDRVQPGIKFNVAKDLYNETSRRLRRVIAPFAEHPDLHEAIEAVRTALQATQTSLKQVRPTDPAKESEAPDAVYYGIEDNFATINNCVADLLGLVEKHASFGDNDAEQ